MIRFGSCCSGIDAASVAWTPLGWQAAWFSEIDPFPCDVLEQRWPDVPNLGDMELIDPEAQGVADIDVLIGGTPCQSFSVAGLRKGLSDERGNLTLSFVRLANAIDAVRARRGQRGAVVLWENVPGVLNHPHNPLGCVLAGLAGEDVPLQPPGDGWKDAGCVSGPKRNVAWRILDAQFFGVPQRRRRVFVVASPPDGPDPCTILFEREGVRRNPAPRGETREGVASSVAPSIGVCGRGFARAGESRGQDPVIVAPLTSKMAKGTCGPAGDECQNRVHTCQNTGQGWWNESDLAQAVRCSKGGGSMESNVVVSHSLRADGFDASEDGTGRGTPLVPVAFHTTQDPISGDVSPALGQGSANGCGQIGVCFDTTWITSKENRSNPQAGDPCHPLQARAHPPALAFQLCGDSDDPGVSLMKGDDDVQTPQANPRTLLRRVRDEIGTQAFAEWGLGILDSLQSKDVLRQALHGSELRPASFSQHWVVICTLGSPFSRSEGAVQSLREALGSGCPSPGWKPSEQFARELGAYLSELSQPGSQAERFLRDLWFAAEGFGLLRETLSAVQEARRPAYDTGMSGGMAVRRLVVEECELLQGFPRGYLDITYRGKPAADGPKYKALGNSMAVPVIRWIGERIFAIEFEPMEA